MPRELSCERRKPVITNRIRRKHLFMLWIILD